MPLYGPPHSEPVSIGFAGRTAACSRPRLQKLPHVLHSRYASKQTQKIGAYGALHTKDRALACMVPAEAPDVAAK